MASADEVREYAKQLVLQLAEQLQHGCGDAACTNPECAQNRTGAALTQATAVAAAIAIVQRPEPEQYLCGAWNTTHGVLARLAGPHPVALAADDVFASPLLADADADDAPDNAWCVSRAAVMARDLVRPQDLSLTCDMVEDGLAAALAAADTDAFVRHIRTVFGSWPLLAAAFVVPGTDLSDAHDCGLDYDGIVRAYEALYAAPDPAVASAVVKAAEWLMTDITFRAPMLATHAELRPFLTVLLNPFILSDDAAVVLRKSLLAVSSLSDDLKHVLVTWLAAMPYAHLATLVATLQSYILVRIMSVENLDVRADIAVVSTVRVLALAHAANALREAAARSARSPLPPPAAPLPESDFYNDAINSPDWVDLHADYLTWVDASPADFSFCAHPFLLDAATKADVVFLESELQMRREGRRAMIQSMLSSSAVSPYLVLRVRRDNIIRDTLDQLASREADFKKEMKVKFVGEDGVDEGGVRKEFFQVIIRSLFAPDFGMFKRNDDNDSYYFHPGSLEGASAFRLCGIILGLAIYNKVIIDMHFPAVVYKRLCNLRPTLADYIDASPTQGRSLQFLLDYDGDFADLSLSWEYTYERFGEHVVVELCPNGSSTPVTADNVAAYVDAYVAYDLVDGVATQYDAFEAGFRSVVNADNSDRAAISLFSPAELELLICGSDDLDLHELESVTRYEGFDPDHPTIRNFWSVVHDFPLDLKKKLLFFATGSDRVPIKGLKALNFVVMRDGPDSDRLPTSHTCFNYLALPAYEDLDKLRRLLLAAITNTEGFGLV